MLHPLEALLFSFGLDSVDLSVNVAQIFFFLLSHCHYPCPCFHDLIGSNHLNDSFGPLSTFSHCTCLAYANLLTSITLLISSRTYSVNFIGISHVQLTFCDCMDWSLPGSSVHGIFHQYGFPNEPSTMSSCLPVCSGLLPHLVFSTFVPLVILLLHLECFLSSFVFVFLLNISFNSHFVPQ